MININFLKEIKSLEKLKETATEQEIADFVNSFIPNMNLVKLSYEDIWQTIQFLQKNLIPFNDSFFVSEQKKYIYILTHLEGKSKTKELGISDDMYEDKEKAKAWRNKILQYVHPDKGGNESAFNELNKLYQTMTDIEDSEN